MSSIIVHHRVPASTHFDHHPGIAGFFFLTRLKLTVEIANKRVFLGRHSGKTQQEEGREQKSHKKSRSIGTAINIVKSSEIAIKQLQQH